MVRPARFHPNPETAADNGYQRPVPPHADLAEAAHRQVSAAAQALRDAGVRVHLFDDDGRHGTPDSVFPNNWFSTHADGRIVVYPMHATNRRAERRHDVLEHLRAEYRVRELLDWSGLADEGVALEGTGAMVLDHVHRVAYLARSRRTDEALFLRWCVHLGFAPCAFETQGPDGRPVYHTNVLMCVAPDVVLLGMDLVQPRDRDRLQRQVLASGRRLIVLSPAQIRDFAGNALALATPSGPVLALSTRAAASLRPDQRIAIEAGGTRLLPLDVSVIEQAGGSVRCMLAGVHLPRRGSAP